ncbi:thermonuclease family protein [Tsuneonella sp. HG222]
MPVLPVMILALLCAACSPLPAAEPLTAACSVTDGDTLRCGEERVRLLGIDAPETAGHCRPGRQCAPGDPTAATNSLRAAIAGQDLTIQRIGKDRYGRTLAIVRAGGVNLSCRQLAGGSAIYVRRWDTKQAVARDCSDLAR